MFDIRYSRNLTRQVLKATLFIAVLAGFVAVSIHYPSHSALLSPLQPNAVASSSLPANLTPPSETQAGEAYGKLPLSFEVNKGQSNAQVKFLSRGSVYALFLTNKEVVLALRDADVGLRMKFLWAERSTQVEGQSELPGKANYILGNDPRK